MIPTHSSTIRFVFLTLGLAFCVQAEELALIGDFEGHFLDKSKTKCVAQVSALGNGEFKVRLFPAFNQRTETWLLATAKQEGSIARFKSGKAYGLLTGVALSGELPRRGEPTRFELLKVQRKSPSAGAKPPPQADVLFDGSDFSQWILYDSRTASSENYLETDKEIPWRLVKGEAMESIPAKKGQPKHDLATRKQYTDVFLHMEFKLPFEPENRGQGRSNSGVFVRHNYEAQILDSYNLEGVWNECGSFYRSSAPMANAAYPPERWQTYDILFKAPVFDPEGRKTKPAISTVYHNGVLIHREQPVPLPTRHPSGTEPTGPTMIWLQDHGHEIQFRNIWAVDLKKHANLTLADLIAFLK